MPILQTHTVKAYDTDLRDVAELAARMGSLVEQQFAACIQAIHARDNAIAGETFHGDDEIDNLETELNRKVLNILALRQPMAMDLRTLVGFLRISRDLERIGDYAANIAKRARTLNTASQMDITNSFVRMANLVAPILKDVIDAFINHDVELAKDVYRRDDDIDDAYDIMIEDLMSYMQKHPKDIESCTHLLFMAKNLERVGDRATNIAETVLFIVSGETKIE